MQLETVTAYQSGDTVHYDWIDFGRTVHAVYVRVEDGVWLDIDGEPVTNDAEVTGWVLSGEAKLYAAADRDV